MKLTLLASSTSLSLKVPTAVPVRLTVSPVYALPSLLVPAPAALVACSAAVPLTAATVVASYTLLALLRPLAVMALAVMLPLAALASLMV